MHELGALLSSLDYTKYGRFAACLLLWTLASALPNNAATRDVRPADCVLVVVNRRSADSMRIGDTYLRARAIPADHLCRLDVTTDEEISRDVYIHGVEQPITACLSAQKLTEQVLYIVTTLHVPLKIAGSGDAAHTTQAAVDSELAALYGRLHGALIPYEGLYRNPYFAKWGTVFRHPDVPIYMVTRLAGYDFADVARSIENALAAKNRGKVVIDVRADEITPGNSWLRLAAKRVPLDRLVLDDSAKVLYDQTDVIAYASWGFNDPDRRRRLLGFKWLPGAIMTEFVSTNARTFLRPPATWTLGNWKDTATWFSGSPQDMSADEIHEGVTGVTGHVFEPYLELNPRPDILIPAYIDGRNLAESFYLSVPAISWQNVMIGDPLCTLRPISAP